MAGRIPQSFIDDVLDRTDIVELIDQRVKLKRSGRNYSARCPFHDEKTPSFSVNPERQFYYCFGCGAGGNALSFVMEYDRLDFVGAIESLAQRLGLEIPREQADTSQQDQSRRKLYTLMQQCSDAYRAQLREPVANNAVDYLKRRGLTGNICAEFGIGYAPPGWDFLLAALGKDAAAQKMLLDAGMLIEKEQGGYYDRFRDRVMFPIRDARGRVIAFGGRVLGDEKPKYLNSPETAIFHKHRELYGLYEAMQASRHLQKLLVVEGYMDVVALAQYDIRFAVATLGTSIGSDHADKIFRHVSDVVFCFDGDNAGRAAAHRALQAVLPLMQDGRQARFLFLPEGEDPDSLVRKQGREHFLWLVDNATPLSDFVFDTAADGLDLRLMDARARFSKLAMSYIQQLPAGVFRELMLKALSERTGLSGNAMEELQSQLPAPTKSANRHETEHRPPPKQRSTLPPAQRKIRLTPALTAVALLLNHPDLATDADTPPPATDQDAQLLHDVLQHLRNNVDASSAALWGHWMLSPQASTLAQLLAMEQFSDLPADDARQELRDCLAHLNHRTQDQQAEALLASLRENRGATLTDAQKTWIAEYLARKSALKS